MTVLNKESPSSFTSGSVLVPFLCFHKGYMSERVKDRHWCGQDFLLFSPMRQGALKLWNKAVQGGKGSHLIHRDVVILQPYMHTAFLSLLDLQHFMV